MNRGEYELFEDYSELWQAPLTPQAIPSAYQPLPALLFPSPDGGSSPGSPSPAPEAPTTSSSPLGPSDGIPPRRGPNGGRSRPTTSGQVQAKCLLLTWSQAPLLSKERIRDHLSSLGDLEALAVGQETHADGGTHFHACVLYKEKVRLMPSAFDLLDYHPNVKAANAKRGPLNACIMNFWTYVQKEDQNPLIVGQPPTMKRTRNALYTEALEMAATKSVEHAMDFLSGQAAMDVALKGDALQRNLTMWRNKKTRHLMPARTLTEFRRHPDIPEAWRVLFLWGKSGVGKTQYAKALLPEASIIRHRNQLTDCDFSKGVIFDDFDVSHWPPTAVIHLLDWDEVTGTDVKYGYVVIPPHTKKIFTFNRRPDAWCPPSISEEQFQAVLRRMHSIEINETLF